MQGLRNVLTDERLFLPTVDTIIDLLGIAHGRIMPYLTSTPDLSFIRASASMLD
jgi:hypothetical protein